MKIWAITAVALCSPGSLLHAQDAAQRAWQLESKGDAAAARSLLQREAQSGNAPASSLRAYAEFLDRHHDPGTRQAYQQLLKSAEGTDRQGAARRLVLLDIFAEDRAAACGRASSHRAAC